MHNSDLVVMPTTKPASGTRAVLTLTSYGFFAMDDAIQQPCDCEQAQHNRVVEKMLLAHPKQWSARELSSPGAQQGQECERAKEAADRCCPFWLIHFPPLMSPDSLASD